MDDFSQPCWACGEESSGAEMDEQGRFFPLQIDIQLADWALPRIRYFNSNGGSHINKNKSEFARPAFIDASHFP